MSLFWCSVLASLFPTISNQHSATVEPTLTTSCFVYGSCNHTDVFVSALCPTYAAYYGNRAATYMMLGNYDKALADARQSTGIDSKFTKVTSYHINPYSIFTFYIFFI